MRKITWENPDDILINKVYIYRSSTKGGSYTTIASTDSTSDGNIKSNLNQWSSAYTDLDGNRTDYYKLRFYYGTYSTYSEYSESATELQRTTLCTIDDVKRYIDTVGKFTDTQIFKKIKEIDSIIYAECGRPIAETRTGINEDYDKYYLGEPDIYRVDRFFYGTISKTEYYEDDAFVIDKENGIIRFKSAGSGAPVLSDTCEIYVRFVPVIFQKLSALRTAKALIEETDVLSSGKPSKELTVIENRLVIIEKLVMDRVGVLFSGDRTDYNTTIGINAKTIVQDYDFNNFSYCEP